ncbi:hypothetical protein RHMOL_Rhmol02G0178500 [Rhododendron molle]|uniref:Uncharacterized protein n=1 Tax=Rhododendron molle TaxID=49168 RepID=A0ACC0PUH0_RHOML|nr:hypothetical protein RHMOL_Rhmol02G0178500 [Rhododendron molle]
MMVRWWSDGIVQKGVPWWMRSGRGLPVMLMAQTHHPLDPLTAVEISIAVATVRAAGATLEVNDIHQADACKVTPAKCSGSKEVVPLHFRKVAIINNLPPTWPKATIFKNLKLNFMDMRALGAMLMEIETDVICSEALDKVEQQFTKQEEKQGKKPRQKVAKRRLEFDEL